jgi:hypothetical protein
VLSREEAVYLFRCILNREPESEDAVSNIRSFKTLSDAREALLRTLEFQNQHELRLGLPPTGIRYIPEKPLRTPIKRGADRLALAAIVKDEEKNIETMLSSCLPVIDFVVLADTGSSDRTIELAGNLLRREGVPHEIRQIHFLNFSQARNAALDLMPARIDWILMLDADERLVPEDYQKLLDLLEADVDGWLLPRYNFSDAEKKIGVQPYPDFQQRLFRNRHGNPVRYSRPIHETIEGDLNWRHAPQNTTHVGGSPGGPHIHHMGNFQTATEEDRRERKVKLYSRLTVRFVG